MSRQDLQLTLNYGYLDAHIKNGLTEDGLGFQDTNDPSALLSTAHPYKPDYLSDGQRPVHHR